MKRLLVFSLFSIVLSLSTASPAQDVELDKEKQGREQVGKKPSKEQIRQALQDALDIIDAIEQASQKVGFLNIRSFESRVPDKSKAETHLMIARAIARLGDVEAARKLWQTSIDSAGRMSDMAEKADVLQQIAVAQAEAGDREEAQGTLQQAKQVTRLIRDNELLPIEMREFDGNPIVKKASALKKIAVALGKADAQPAAAKTFAEAIEVAESIKDPLVRILSLMAIAAEEEPATAIGTRKKCLQIALGLEGVYRKAKAMEAVLRGSVKAEAFEETIKTVENDLQGDLKSYALCIIADQLLERQGKTPPEVVTRLLEIVEKAEFDRSTKKSAVLRRFAEVQALMGDEEGAYRTMGAIHPENAVLRSNYQRERVHLMRQVAQTQLEAGDQEAARNTLQVALEIVHPFAAAGGSAGFGLPTIAELQTRADDLDGATQTLNLIDEGAAQVEALVAIARVQGESNDQEQAKKTLERALRIVKRVSDEDLWADVVQRDYLRRTLPPSSLETLKRIDLSFSMSKTLAALERIAAAQAFVGDVASALETASSISAETSSGRLRRESAIKEIMKAQIGRGDFDGALKTAALVKESSQYMISSRGSVLEAIAREQARRGDVGGVLEWVKKRDLPIIKLVVLRALADGVIRGLETRQEPPASVTP